jgi:hypothetical protein
MLLVQRLLLRPVQQTVGTPPPPQYRISIETLTRVARPVIAHGFGKTVARKHQQEGHHHQGYALAQGCGGRRDGLGSDRGGSATPLLRKAEGGGTASHYRTTVSGEVLRWNGVKKMHSMKMKVEETHAVTGVINRVTSVRTYSQDSRPVPVRRSPKQMRTATPRNLSVVTNHRYRIPRYQILRYRILRYRHNPGAAYAWRYGWHSGYGGIKSSRNICTSS